jgi:glycosyltransferase involved in cell wall biosynthesis
MRIGIDHGPASRHAPGVGRYARELVAALAQQDGDHSLHLLDVGLRRRRVRDLGLERPRCPVVRRRVPIPRRWLGVGGCPGSDVLAGGVDLFHHVLADPAPVTRALQTLTLSELPAPGSSSAGRLARTLAGLDGVLVFSQAAARDVVSGMGVPTEHVHVVPVGCDHWRRGRDERPLPDAPPTLLVLGKPRASRHPLTILAAWRRLRARGVRCRLRFVGSAGEQDGAFARAVQEEHDVTHELPEESELPEVMTHASLLVHLSDAEATAVTPLEAFSFGVGVVASALPAFTETLDGEARLVDTAAVDDDPERLADELAAALEDAGRDDARARREAVAARFTWVHNARATLAVWSALVDGRR